jgi:hypothetical protein
VPRVPMRTDKPSESKKWKPRRQGQCVEGVGKRVCVIFRNEMLVSISFQCTSSKSSSSKLFLTELRHFTLYTMYCLFMFNCLHYSKRVYACLYQRGYAVHTAEQLCPKSIHLSFSLFSHDRSSQQVKYEMQQLEYSGIVGQDHLY